MVKDVVQLVECWLVRRKPGLESQYGTPITPVLWRTRSSRPSFTTQRVLGQLGLRYISKQKEKGRNLCTNRTASPCFSLTSPKWHSWIGLCEAGFPAPVSVLYNPLPWLSSTE